MECYLCDTKLTDSNRTREHIIPGALGNNLISTELICHGCNNSLASQIDAALIAFYAYLYGLVQEARPRTNAKNKLVGKTKSGEIIRFSAGMKPDTQVTIELPDASTLSISCPDTEVEATILRHLRQLKGKFPQIEPEQWLAKMQRTEKPFEELVYFTNYDTEHSKTGDMAFFRGIKRIALNFYLSKGYDKKYVREVINQVKHGIPANEKISTFYYPRIRSVHELGAREISHVIKLVGDPEKKALYCYVELFNCNHALILLNKHYDGPAIDHQYCYDVLTSTYLRKSISLPFKHRTHVLDCFAWEQDTNPQGDEAYKRTRRILAEAIRDKGYIE